MVRIAESRQMFDGAYLFLLSCGCEARVDKRALLVVKGQSEVTRAFDDLVRTHVCQKTAPRALPDR